MKIEIQGTPEEIAALVLAVQERRGTGELKNRRSDTHKVIRRDGQLIEVPRVLPKP